MKVFFHIAVVSQTVGSSLISIDLVMERLVRKSLARQGASIRAFPTYHPTGKCQHFSAYLFYVTDWLADFSSVLLWPKEVPYSTTICTSYATLIWLSFDFECKITSPLCIHTLYHYTSSLYKCTKTEEAWRQSYSHDSLALGIRLISFLWSMLNST